MNQHDPEYWRELYEPYEPKWHSKTYLKRKYKPHRHSKLYYQNKYIYGGRTPKEQLEQERKERRRREDSKLKFFNAKLGDWEQIAFLVLIFLWLIGAGR